MSNAATIAVRTLSQGARVRDWLDVPHVVMGDDPCWIRPLDFMERQRIGRRSNPFFGFGEAEFFIAYRGGRPVGRISAQVNRRHLEHHRDETGHFGFFDCIDDLDVARALAEQAVAWLLARGMKRIAGPFNLTINQEAGLLVSGVEHPPAVMTPHSAPWLGGLIEQCGFAKVIDLYAYRMRPAETPPKLQRLADFATKGGRVRVRNMDLKRYAEEARLMIDIFNDAWSDNWGFVPVSKPEADALFREMRPIMRSKFGWVAEIDGEAAAMMILAPDLNRVFKPFDGRILPFNWAKLGLAIWRDDWRTARVGLLGIRKKHRNTLLAGSVLSLMMAELLKLGRQYSFDWVEVSWVLETNTAMTALAETGAGKPAKTYRIYGRNIG